MIISSSQIQSLIAQYSKPNQKIANKNEVKNVQQKCLDKLNVSNDAQAYLIARQAINNVPDVREQKVAELENRVKSGTYEVKDEDIAEKMLGRTLVDKLV